MGQIKTMVFQQIIDLENKRNTAASKREGCCSFWKWPPNKRAPSALGKGINLVCVSFPQLGEAGFGLSMQRQGC